MSGSWTQVRGRFGRLVAAFVVAFRVAPVVSVAFDVGTAPAGAAGCGVVLGTPQLQGALGSIVFDVPTAAGSPGRVLQRARVRHRHHRHGGHPADQRRRQRRARVCHGELFARAARARHPLGVVAALRRPGVVALRLLRLRSRDRATSVSINGAASPCSSFGNVSSATLQAPIVAIPNPETYVGMAGADGNLGYWLVQRGGGVSPFGSATNVGSPITNVAVAGVANAGGGGYWVATADGGVFAYGAPFFGSRAVCR